MPQKKLRFRLGLSERFQIDDVGVVVFHVMADCRVVFSSFPIFP
jgi:hypothetical protein